MKELDILAFRTHLQILMVDLREMEVKVLQMRFGLVDGTALPPEEVGHQLKLTGERVRLIEAKALQKMRPLEAGEYDWLVELLPWIKLLRALKG